MIDAALSHPAIADDHMAAVVEGVREACLREAPLPVPAPGQVVVRLEGSGICGSDIPVWTGASSVSYPLEPGAPGHEGWGVISERGDGVAGLPQGTRVALLSHHAYARYDVAAADAVVPLPDAVEGAFPGEAVACAMNVAARSGIQPDSTVTVVGVGFLGALLIQMASGLGATVIAVSRRPFALAVARRCGATHALALDDDAVERVADLTAGSMCEVAIEAAGRQRTLDLASSLVATRGRLVIAGYHQDGSRTVDMRSWNWRGLDVVNAHERDPAVYLEGMRRGIGEVLEGRLDVRSLVTHEFPLEELPRALDTAAQRPDGFLKAVVRS